MMNNVVKEVNQVVKRLLNDMYDDKKRITMFDSSLIKYDGKKTLYDKNGVCVLWCEAHDYIEIIGLTSGEFRKVFKKYGCYE